ncbi:MAG: GNAT family N-acetyltransferase [bacterium]|nr:GNAT family N-acetyltransferase [bacterium]
MKIRSVSTPRELRELHLKWSIDQAWNPGLYDGDTYLELDRKGFLVGSVRETPVAVIAAARSGGYGHIGLFMSRPEFRGKGYGHQLFDEAMDYLKDCDYVCLDSVLEQKDSYEKKGFRPGHMNTRYKAVAPGKGSFAPAKIFSGIIPLLCVPFELTASYCDPYFPGPREAFFRAYLSQPEAITFGKVDRYGAMQGVIVARKALDGYKIGPLFAEDYGTAGDLMDTVLSTVKPGENIYIDMPSNNPNAAAFSERYSMEEDLPLLCMVYSNNNVVESMKANSSIYAITSSNVG